MRVAALYDVHANLPALEAVLEEVERADPDLIVIGGDVVPGPMPRETIERLRALGGRARFVMGNGDRAVLDGDAGQGGAAGAWVTAQLDGPERDLLAGFEATVSLAVDGLGQTLFCHGSPRSDTEMITTETSEERLAPMLGGVAEDTVVCGHTHRQFDRRAHGKRLINAGAVGMPYEGEAAAFWALLGPEAELRRTDYDIGAAAEAMRATGFPDVDELMLRESLLEPTDPDAVARYFEEQATGGSVKA
jgi:predicted phosphodiesterase